MGLRKTMRAVVVAAALLAAPPGLLPGAVAAEPAQSAPSDAELATWVDQKVEACQPKAAERTFDQTGWLTEIVPALKLAKEHNRPVMLFTHDGRMARGRC